MTQLGIGLIGLGSIGQRMLRNAAVHARVRPRIAWDPDSAKLSAATETVSELASATDADAVINDRSVDIVYVASPPLTHAAYGHAALDAGKPVLCEKPLGIDLEASRTLVTHAERTGLPNAVNFIYASGAGSVLADAIETDALGSVCSVEVRLHARRWAERRYAEAPWLACNDQGGLVREVISHYVFLCQRLLGPARVRYAHVDRIDAGAETHAIAHLECGEVPVHIVARTEGVGPGVFECTLRGQRAARRTRNLYELWESSGERWQPVPPVSADPAAEWFRQQLDNVAAWARGEAHTMPSFASALAVQEVVEKMLAVDD